MHVPHQSLADTHPSLLPRLLPWLVPALVPLMLLAGIIVWQLRGQATVHPRATRVATPATASARASGGRWVPTQLTAEIDALLEDPTAPRHLLAGTSDGLRSSRDDGATWRRVGGELGGARIFALAAGRIGRILFAGGNDGTVFALLPGPGASWRRISPTLGANPIFSLAVSPEDGQTVLAGTAGALFRGVRAGNSWRWRRVATTDDSSVTAIGWTLSGRRQVFASVFGTTPPVLSSDDGGLRWHADARGLPATLPTEALVPLTGTGQRMLLSTMGAGVWARASGGEWRDVSSGLPEHHAMPMITAGPGDPVFAGTMGSGVYRWQAGRPWKRVGRGLLGGQYIVLSLTLTSGAHPTLLAGTSVGIWRYTGRL